MQRRKPANHPGERQVDWLSRPVGHGRHLTVTRGRYRERVRLQGSSYESTRYFPTATCGVPEVQLTVIASNTADVIHRLFAMWRV